MDKYKSIPIGKTFCNLTVISRAPNDSWGHRKWNCECSCGKKTCVATRQLGKTISCGCAKIRGQTGSNVTGKGDVTGTLLNTMRGSAKRRSIPFEVTAAYIWDLYLLQEGKCAISGIPISFGEKNNKWRRGRSASLDRIDSSLGYTEGNVQWVDRRINSMKLELSMPDFLSLIATIHKFNTEPSPK